MPPLRPCGGEGDGRKIRRRGFTGSYPFAVYGPAMDLSFTLRSRGRAPDWVVSLADIRAAADRWRTIGTWRPVPDPMRPTDDGVDRVRLLADRLVTGRVEIADAAALGGSFNLRIAYRLMVGGIE